MRKAGSHAVIAPLGHLSPPPHVVGHPWHYSPLETAKNIKIPALRDRREAIALRVREGRTYKQIDEVRAEAGLPLLGKERGGHLVLHPGLGKARQARKRRARG
jgi:hypothetical protein